MAAKDVGDELAEKPIQWIREIFAIEREGKHLPAGELLALRQARSGPVVEELKAWIDRMLLSNGGLPKGPLMEAVGYASNQWETLTRFLEDGEIREITNNGCERSLRALVVGRKNWLFFGSKEGTLRGTVLLSLVQSCKELGINPLAYLRDVLRAIAITPASRVAELTPLGWKQRHESAVGLEIDASAVEAAVRQITYPS